MEKIVRIEPFKVEPGQVFANGYEKVSKIARVPGVKLGITRGKTPIDPKDEKQLELDLNLAPGTLAPRSTFWETYKIRIGDRGETLHMNDPWDRLKLAVLKVVDEVAPTLSDRFSPQSGGRYQEAKFYISDPEAEAQTRNADFDLEDKTIMEFGKLSADMKKVFARLLGCLSNPKASDSVIHSSLREFIGASSGNKNKFLDLISRKKEELICQNEVMEALELGLLKKLKGGKIQRVYGEGVEDIASRLEEAVEYYLETKNMDLRDELRHDIAKAKSLL